MALNNNDLTKIGSLMDQKFKDFDKTVDQKFKDFGEVVDQKFKTFGETVDQKFKDFGEVVDQKFKTFGETVDQKFKDFGEVVDQKLAASESRLMGEVGKFMEDHLFPMIDEKADKSDIDRLERKLDRVIDVTQDHEHRIKAIEQVPVVAHELKLKKPK